MNKKIVYVAELNLPNDSAYSIHVMKMCESFASLGYEVYLYVISLKEIKNIFKYYNVKHKFKIKPIFKYSKTLGFFARTIFSTKIIFETKNKPFLFLSRSIIFAILNTTINRKTILELHHEITGLTRIIYYFLKNLGLLNNLKYIFLHKNLLRSFSVSNNKFLILDDAVNLDDYKKYKNKKYSNTAVYVGSFFKGKGTEFIAKLARTNPKIKFHLYGKADKKYKIQNLKLKGFKRYRDIPGILSKYNLALMPYSNKVFGKSAIELQNYMSPLKMFDYMASRKIILANNLKIYNHILRNDFNCKLLKVNDVKDWTKTINNIFKDIKKYKYLSRNAYRTVQKYTWNSRTKKILKKFSK